VRRYTVAGAKRRAGRLLRGVAHRISPVPDPTSPEDFPAGFKNWAARRSSRLFRGFPDHWDITDWSEKRSARVVVVLHVHFPDLLAEIVRHLATIPVPFDVIVTDSSGANVSLDRSELPLADRIIVLPIANHGRDILPLVSVVNSGMLDGYDLVAKVHTKRSAWRESHGELSGSGDAWRESLLGELFGTEENVRSILAAFGSDPSIGLLTAAGSVVGTEFWGGDKEIVRSLLERLQLELDDRSLSFASGSMYWTRSFTLQGLRALQLTAEDFEPEAGQVDGTTAHAIERIIGIVTAEAGYRTVETAALDEVDDSDSWVRYTREFSVAKRATTVAFYLPQFHPFAENNSWWGTGFTEWSNVAAAKPVFVGHNQPLLPADLGFYDLRTPGVMESQAKLAEDAGLGAMMFYYYWFAGKRLMNFPVERFAELDSPVSFSIMWANENWTRTWDGGEASVLIGQAYDKVPAEQFIDDVMPLLLNPRYLRVDNKPVVSVYRVAQIPSFPAVIATWRQRAVEAGLDGLVILTADVGSSMQGIDGDIASHGVDGLFEFAPHNMPWDHHPIVDRELSPRFTGNTMSYAMMANHALQRLGQPLDVDRYPGLMVNFDNTARRQWRPDLWYGSNPYTFRRWLDAAVGSVSDRDRDHRLVFLNAWNEWAEGTVLEPTQRWGATYLQAVKDVLTR
jgi:lipopolysaccharide biosynthesis protein